MSWRRHIVSRLFLDSFKLLIREGNYDNTYKMAWAKALVEISIDINPVGNTIQVPISSIAKKVIKYYWNQTIFFDLIQGSNLKKPPSILQIVTKLISEYRIETTIIKPDFFEKIEHKFSNKSLNNHYSSAVKNTIAVLKKDVSYRFLVFNGTPLEGIYEYNKGDDFLYIESSSLESLKDNQQDLFDLINYRWGLILETFNSSPRINKKVRITDEREIRRKPLAKFMNFLDYENPNRICFICGEKIDVCDLSIDHIIPWSYLYSDDIWNLVYVHKGCNSIKGNMIPQEKEINRLIVRNKTLLEILNQSQVKNKLVDELELSLQRDFVHKFWIGSRG